MKPAERDGAEDGPLNWAPIVLEKLDDAVEDGEAQGEARVGHRYVHCHPDVRVGQQWRCSPTAVSISARIGSGRPLLGFLENQIRVGFQEGRRIRKRFFLRWLLARSIVRVPGPAGALVWPGTLPGSLGVVRHIAVDDEESAMVEAFGGTPCLIYACSLCMSRT